MNRGLTVTDLRSADGYITKITEFAMLDPKPMAEY